MKVLVVMGNPNKRGVCERLGGLFVAGMKEGGADVCVFDAAASEIGACRGCFACVASGRCVIDDAMGKALELLSDADALVCVSPVYFYSMSSQMKAFFDRCFPVVRGYEYDSENKRYRNVLELRKPRKKFVTISAASGRLSESFDALSKTYSTIAEAFGFDYCADMRRAESAYFGAVGAGSRRVRRILDAYFEAGKSFAETGSVGGDLLAAAQMEISGSGDEFARRSKIFWELYRSGKTDWNELKNSDGACSQSGVDEGSQSDNAFASE